MADNKHGGKRPGSGRKPGPGGKGRRVSIYLSGDLLAEIERQAALDGKGRSAALAKLLRSG